MSGGQAGFRDLFWHHLTPRLTRLIVAHARCIAAEVEDYGDAFDSIMRYARKYGSGYLSNYDYDKLTDWIGAGLINALVEAEAGGWAEWCDRTPYGGPGARL